MGVHIIHTACEQIADNPFRIRQDGCMNRIDVNSLKRDVELLQSVLSQFEKYE